jgi:hypothetical protein
VPRAATQANSDTSSGTLLPDAHGARAVVTSRFKEKNKSGAELGTQAEQVWEIRDGKIARFENKVDQEAWAKGWS